MPREPGWILDGSLKGWLGPAICDDVQPVAFPAVLRNPPFVRREQDRAGRLTQSFDLDETKLPRIQIETGEVVAKVLLMDIIDLTALRALVVQDRLHRSRFGLRVRLEATHLGGFPLRVRQDQDASEPLHGLQRETPLPL